MGINIHDYISKRKERMFADIDFHNFIELKEAGLSTQEMSNELGISKVYASKLIEELKRNY